MNKIIKLIAILFGCLIISTTNALAADNNGFYVGALLGWGTTTWGYLVDSKEWLSKFVTPTEVHEGGTLWGCFAGFEFNQFFALELQYMRCPRAKVYFWKWSLYTTEDKVKEIDSRTDAYSLTMKIMTPVFHTPIKIFAAAGGAMERRSDKLAKQKTNLGGVFGAGLNVPVTEKMFAELAFQYYTGHGKTEIRPVYRYIPFIYTVHFKLAYRFN